MQKEIQMGLFFHLCMSLPTLLLLATEAVAKVAYFLLPPAYCLKKSNFIP